jgi:hypothetical protein
VESERRRVPRHAFGGVAEVSASEPSAYIVGKTTELSRLGCFVQTCQQLPVGTAITLKISYEGIEFDALGTIAYSLPQKGMGISFVPLTSVDEELLDEWLKVAAGD